MTIKSQTLIDYHNHIIRLINREIEKKQRLMGEEFRKGNYEKYYEIGNEIKILENIKGIIHWDWINSNYSKCGDVE